MAVGDCLAGTPAGYFANIAISRPSLTHLLRIISLALATGAVATAIMTWVLFDVAAFTTDISDDLVGVIDPTAEAIEVADRTIANAQDAVVSVVDVSDEVAAATSELAETVAVAAELTSQDVPNALGSFEASLPGLIDTATIVDRTMRALSIVGVQYSPEVPLQTALEALQQDLTGIPDGIRATGRQLEGLGPRLESSAASVGNIGMIAQSLSQNLTDAQTVIEDYRLTVAAVRVESETLSSLGSLLPIGRIAAVVVALSGMALGVGGWIAADRLSSIPTNP